MIRARHTAVLALLAGSALCAPLFAQDAPPRTLDEQFADPPASARPRVWWHWMNGNITEEGIRKDLEWMKRSGIGGVQAFDANLQTPQIVKDRLVYMSPAWRKAFRSAVHLADDLGLEFAIASSPGWSETGGPWVKPADGMKKLVWSETLVEGGKRFTGRLATPPAGTGAYQTMGRVAGVAGLVETKQPVPDTYGDAAVLAFPDDSQPLPAPRYAMLDGTPLDAVSLGDGDYSKALEIARDANGKAGIVATFPSRQTIRSLTLYLPDGKPSSMGAPGVHPRIEASDDGVTWRAVADTRLDKIPTTIGFPAVTAARFRVIFDPEPGKSALPGDPAPGVVIGGMGGGPAAQPAPLKLAELRFDAAAKISRFQAKAGFDVVRDYYDLAPATGMAQMRGVDPKAVVDLTARLRPDGTLDWTPPKGRWKVVRLGWSLVGTTNHPATEEATGLEVDKYDPAAVRRYLDTYLDTYRETVGADLMGARGIRALLTDSIEVGAANWTPELIAQFRRLRGYDPTPWLPALTGVVIGSPARSEAFLYDFRRTLADLLASAHYGTIADVAHRRGMIVYGEALEDNRPQLGDDMTMRRYADVPMAAMWTYARQAGPNPTYLADGKGASSVAHLYGRPVVAAESFTAIFAPWAYGPGDLRRVADLEFALGINRPVIHTSVHQPVDDKVPGLSLFIVGQYFNRHESWAGMARPWMDYLARSSFLLQQGKNVADVAYFHGEEAPLTALYGPAPVADPPGANAYDFINADALAEAVEVADGRIVSKGGASYAALYLGGSSRRMTLATLRRIAALVEAGATVIGPAPTGSPSLNDDAAAYRALVARLWSGAAETRVGRGRVIAGSNVDAGLHRAGIAPDFTYAKPATDSQLLFVHRRLDEGELYFVTNRIPRAETIEGRFRVTGYAPEICRAETGHCTPASYRRDGDATIVTLPLEADDSLFVLFRKRSEVAAFAVTPPAYLPPLTVAGPWQVSFQPGRGAPDSITLPTLASLSEHPDPRVRYFSGEATYRAGFTLPRGQRPGRTAMLDLGEVGVVAEVKVNGRTVGTAWHAPYRLDVGSALKRGRNTLEIKVANLWVNRLIGDAQPGASKITFTTFPTYKADAPLPPSGLIGPVALVGER